MKKIAYINSLYSYSSLPEHPENKNRISLIEPFIVNKQFVKGVPSLQEILELYDLEYLNKIKKMRGLYGDNFFDAKTYLVALNALKTSRIAYNNYGLAVVRPPGHHSYRTYEGFCYFNNIVFSILNDLKQKKILVVDVDAHHGNGTERYALEFKNLYYFSIHANANYYPGTGAKDTEKSRNIPVDPKKIYDENYLELLKELDSYYKKIEPDEVVVSIGFDTWYKDPVLGFSITNKRTYYSIAKYLSQFNPRAHILEGGYSLDIGELFLEYYRGVNSV